MPKPVKLSDITITSLSITGNQDGSENLHISVAYGQGDSEVFITKEVTRDTITAEQLIGAFATIAETLSKD